MKIVLSHLIKDEIKKYFEEKGMELIYTMPFFDYTNSSLLHPDIQCFYDSGVFYTASNLHNYYKKFFSNISVSKKELKGIYPDDALFNCLKIKNKIFCNEKYLDKSLLRELSKKYEIINVNQGYTNCSSLYIGKNIVVTSDNGMKNTFLKNGLDVFFIDNINIKLKGFKNGFIGGCAINTGEEIVFFGKLENEFKKIKNLLEKNQIKYKEFDFPLEDFGSAILIK